MSQQRPVRLGEVGTHSVAGTVLGLVDRGRCGVPALCPHPRSAELLPAHLSSGEALRF